jgi:hypothetical protein
MEEYTSSSSNELHSFPGEEENIVLSRGMKIKRKINVPRTMNTMLILSGFLQILILTILLPLLSREWRLLELIYELSHPSIFV